MKLQRLSAALIFILITLLNTGQSKAQSYLYADPTDQLWWEQARFGMFIHWGPVTIEGREIGWSRGEWRRKWGGRGTIPAQRYDSLYTEFNPVKFDAGQWMQLAKDAGMKYVVFTTKHHDGFCMYDSKLTNYKITSPRSPYGKDIVKLLADKAREKGLRMGLYYSQPDWKHEHYQTENHTKYIEYFHGQVEELLTGYGDISIIWFDGLSNTSADWDAPGLFKMIRHHQPDILINNRAGIPGDFGTPEQEVGHFNNESPWESCITIAQQWSYNPDDSVKSLQECIHTLVRCAGSDGNLLFNISPMPDGSIPQEQTDRLLEIGRWLKTNGESIYGTRGGPYMPTKEYVSTYNGTKVYIHILEDIGDELLIGKMSTPIMNVSTIDGGKVEWKESKEGISIQLKDIDPLDHIIVLETRTIPEVMKSK